MLTEADYHKLVVETKAKLEAANLLYLINGFTMIGDHPEYADSSTYIGL